jgi:hypothetical protein
MFVAPIFHDRLSAGAILTDDQLKRSAGRSSFSAMELVYAGNAEAEAASILLGTLHRRWPRRASGVHAQA